MPDSCKGAWKLQEVRDQILRGCWVQYNADNDPGTLWSWGRNNTGAMGINTAIGESSPVQVPGNQWSSFSAGYLTSSSAIKADNTLWTWGSNYRGLLGINLIDGVSNYRSSPVQVPGTAWCKSSVGTIHMLALKTDNTLWAWGSNNSCQLGNYGAHRSSPTQIPGTSWIDICAAGSSSFARKSDGTLWVWGPNTQNQFGNNRTECSSGSYSPYQVSGTAWNDISTEGTGTMGRKTDGTLWAWGSNTAGELGLNNTSEQGTPQQIPGTNWTDVCIFNLTTRALKSDGTLWSWGYGRQGQVGTNSTFSGPAYGVSSPVQVPGNTWKTIGGGAKSAFATKTDGTLWAWGLGSQGRLGLNDTINRSSPVQIPGACWLCAGGGYTTLARKLT